MTEKQMKAIKDTWHRFCDNNREYGVFLFLSLFIKHPEFLPMFPHFKGKPVSALKDDPMFRAHGCAIGYHITSLVDSLGDPAKFEVLARRNATDHLKRKGVKPSHFEVLGQCMVDVLQSKDEKYMTPRPSKPGKSSFRGLGAAVAALSSYLFVLSGILRHFSRLSVLLRGLSQYFVAIIKDVFEQAAQDRAEQSSQGSSRTKGSVDSDVRSPEVGSPAKSPPSSKKRSRPTSPTTKQDTAAAAAGGAKKGGGAKSTKSGDK
ncbi:hypothetical protein HPB48_001669 [Haemaphysalis longicornis]|uniref:Globin domain-containing protein n=1 Tax=Haemaphysalis longicornis TaxID=44386 RepID=A0A9J6GPD9_HAELO|nr:hypothetical protein HPB48_001669 [Haemaphysalis longicornis]